jgi:hypothetical protein
LPAPRPTRLPHVDHRVGWPALLRHPIAGLLPGGSDDPKRGALLSNPDSAGARARWYGNINPLSIDYVSRPRLRSRLTLGGLAFPRKPWTFGGGVSRPSFATHAGIRTRDASTAGFSRRFHRVSTLPYHPLGLGTTPAGAAPSVSRRSAASVPRLSPVTLSARNHSTSELLRTLSRMAASKPTSWLSGQLHILYHLAWIWGP